MQIGLLDGLLKEKTHRWQTVACVGKTGLGLDTDKMGKRRMLTDFNGQMKKLKL